MLQSKILQFKEHSIATVKPEGTYVRRLSIFKVGLIYISHSLKLCRVQKSSLLTSAMIWAKAGEAYRVEMTSPRSHSSLEENGTSHNSGVWIQSIPSPFGLDISPCSPYRLPLPQKKPNQILLNRSGPRCLDGGAGVSIIPLAFVVGWPEQSCADTGVTCTPHWRKQQVLGPLRPAPWG